MLRQSRSGVRLASHPPGDEDKFSAMLKLKIEVLWNWVHVAGALAPADATLEELVSSFLLHIYRRGAGSSSS